MTPGPWLITFGDDLIHEISNDKGPIADVFSGEADALAISAAPEMLAALTLILGDNRLMNAMTKVQARAIMDAVAKATTAEVST